ncbi:hypothetical protein [Paraliomyxa miuraensis]|uniref:hypothetical protein n=1 Tax=Paraliomyxa miuraensis TaxID=376150 RepID=UPI00224FB185|nr:hypothetical protein [Paraliomyxa miuraensis]MCX4244402.1 hypothetical protein [Paraliomyxa miuraensis]
MKWSDARLDRLIERELCEGLPPRTRARLHERLRRDARARARYDRAVDAVRVFEGDVDVAPTELAVVQRWLDDGWMQGDATAERTLARRAWPALMTALAAALVVLLVRPLGDSAALRPWTDDDGWQARGPGARRGLALEVLCTADDAAADAAPVRARACELSDLMGLAYRMPEGMPGELSVFGIDAQGDVMFYLPTPVDPSGITVDPGRWRASSVSVRLAVNHAAGPLRIYGVVAPRVATVDEIRAFAAALASRAPAEPGDPSWIDRVSSGSGPGSGPEALAGLCPEPSSCHAAELVLTLRSSRGTP